MSKIIKITPECFDEICKDFESALRNVKAVDGKVSYTKSFGYIARKAVLYFTEKAWLKMQTLIREFDKEVAWHGIAYRGEDASKDEYYINDILVYPQEVTGATVNTDQEKYETWLMSQEDEVFNNIRMQGHSHVNMGTTPSGVDVTHQEKILDQLEDDMFYIFVIWNKRGEKTIKIYDLAKNVLFDTNDVIVEITDKGLGLSAFLEDAKKLVQEKKPPAQVNVTPYKGAYNSGGYEPYYPGAYPYTVKSSAAAPISESPAKDASDKKRKGKRKKSDGKISPSNSCDQITPLWLDDDDDYFDKWYSR